MYKSMLVLLDGSKMSEVVFTYARELSGRLGLDIYLLHVCTQEESEQLPMRQAYIEHMAETLRAESQEICRQAEPDGDTCLLATGKVVVGYPPEEILKYAGESEADLIMMSTHGRSGIRRWGLGSVADKVIHETSLPVWLVPAQLHEGIIFDKMPRQSLLVPLDGSKEAESVVPHVVTLAKQRGTGVEVMLVNVTRPTTTTVTEADRELIGESISAMRTQGQLYLNEVSKKFTDAGIKTSTEQLVGDPAEEIVRYAAAHNPRLILMTTHGRSGFSRFVFGSVAENVLRRLQKTPMLLVRPE